jgi:hypothetical protein
LGEDIIIAAVINKASNNLGQDARRALKASEWGRLAESQAEDAVAGILRAP